ncbi:MAG: aldo/keto reductase, partial [Flavisolibacter sp.]|nr:aldo/keto reductase [Flavisolibacter sp.]
APICSEEGLGVLPYFALAGGFLTGKHRSAEDAYDSKRGGGIVKKYLNERGFCILAALDTVAKRYHTTQASIALAWLIASPLITAPIASATSIQQLNN